MADSTHMKCLDAVKAAAETLSLAGIVDANIVIVENWVNALKDTVANYKAYFTSPPGVFLAPVGVEQIVASSNLRDTVGYPVMFIIYDHTTSGSGFTVASLDKRLYWRQRLRERFHHQKMDLGSGDHVNCEMQFLNISSAVHLAQNRWISSAIIYCQQRESRVT